MATYNFTTNFTNIVSQTAPPSTITDAGEGSSVTLNLALASGVSSSEYAMPYSNGVSVTNASFTYTRTSGT